MSRRLDSECSSLRSEWGTRAAALREEAKNAVTQAVWQDVRDPDLAGDLDVYTKRGTAIALGLSDADNYSLAADNLGWIVLQTKSYGGQVSEAFIRALVFQGIAQTRMYDFDGGVAKITFATERSLAEPITRVASWVKDYLFDEFESWGIRLLAGTAKYPRWIKDSEIHAKQALSLLGIQSYSAISAIRSIFRLAELHYDTPSEYTRMRLLDAYRSLTVAMEALAKAIGEASRDSTVAAFFQSAKRVTLHDALSRLLAGEPAWKHAEDIKSKVDSQEIEPNDPYTTLARRMQVIRKEPRSTLATLLGGTVAGALLVRNFAAHETTFGEVLSDWEVYSSIGESTISTFVYLPFLCQKAGHLERFCDD